MASKGRAGRRAAGRGEWLAYLEARQRGAGAHGHEVLLGLSWEHPFDLHEAVLVGMRWQAFDRLRRVIGLPAATLAEAIGIRPRTLRRRKRAGRLSPHESDRLWRMARVIGLVLELFDGNRILAQRWLETPSIHLSGAVPISFLRTGPGTQVVETLITQVAHGVFA